MERWKTGVLFYFAADIKSVIVYTTYCIGSPVKTESNKMYSNL
jgi:hypothetical protein